MTSVQINSKEQLQPLTGIKVVEFCQVAAGPFCAMLLADLGAQVIKVEPPEGDSLRQWPPLTGGFSENFASLNRGKRSVALDLKNPTQRDQARELVLGADVLIENSRPGTLDRLGLGWNWFAERHPKLIYCSISAFGQSGPRSGEGGFDLTIQAAAGVMSVTGEPEGGPVKCGVPLADFSSGLYAAYSIAAMLARVAQGGAGGHLDVPMFGATLAIAALQTSEYFGTGANPRKLGSAHPRNAPYQAYQAADGWFAIAAGNDKLWRAVCEVVDAAELRTDARFQSPTLRAANQTALKQHLDPLFARCPVQHWLAAFSAAGVPASAINGYAEALADVQTHHLGLVHELMLPNGSKTRTVGCPVRIDGQVVPVDLQLPTIGQHTSSLPERIWDKNPAA